MRCLWLAVPFLTLTLACGDDADGTATINAGGGGSGAGSNAGGTGGGGGGTGGCMPQPGVTPGPDWVCITEVTGTVLDERDAPIDTVLMTVCGPGGCEPDETDATGAFTIDVGFPIFVDDWSTIPHGREMGKMGFYFAFDPDAAGPAIDLGTIRLLDTPADGPSLVVRTDDMGAPAQSVENNGVTLTIPAGVHANLDFEDFSLGEEGKKFRARDVPTNLQDEFIPAEMNALAVYALTPFDSNFNLESDPLTDAEVTLSFPNTTALAPNTNVEILQLGSFLFGDVTSGDWAVAATGTVSSDGSTINMDAGEGLTFLTWLAVRVAP